MAISPMKKVNIVAHRVIQADLLQWLQEMEVLHISDFSSGSDMGDDQPLSKNGKITDEHLEARIADIHFAVNYLSQFEEKRGLISGILSPKIVLSPEQYGRVVEDFDEVPVVQQCRRMDRERSQLLSEIGRLESLMGELQPWLNLELPLEDLSPTESTTIVLGLLPSKVLPELIQRALDLTEAFEAKTVHQGKEGTYLVMIFHNAFREELSNLLNALGFEVIKFGDVRGTPRDLSARILSRVRQLWGMVQTMDEESTRLVHRRQDLQILYDHLGIELQRKRIQTFFGQTEETFVIEGWIPSGRLQNFRNHLREGFREVALVEVEPRGGEIPPTSLENPKSIRPFEVVTELYGMPNSREFDPSPFLAPFFFVFFGLCLTDAAYGIILSGAFLFFLRRYRATLGKMKLMWVLLSGGISAIFMGAITGGWFGDIAEYLPPSLGFLKEARESLMLFDPMDQVMIFILITLIIGFVQICFGLAIRLVRNIRDGDWIEALCSPLVWLILINSIVLAFLGQGGVLPPLLKTVGLVSAICSAITIILFTDRTTSNPVVRMAWGIYELYGITSYLGNVLSYLRLFALGLATAIIATVVNLLGDMVLGWPYLGWAIFIPAFVLGHLFNIAINGLGAFVHTLRLQYVEFFPRFFQGGGRRFTPFKKNPRYTLISVGP